MAIENFSTYTEVDEDGDITVTSAKCDVSTMRYDAVSYVKKSYGAGHFGDFEHLFKGRVDAADNGAWHGAWLVSNSNWTGATCWTNWDGLGLNFNQSAASRTMYLQNYETHSLDGWTGYSLETDYWFTAKRVGSAVTMKIYSDAARLNLLDTLSVTADTTTYEWVSGIHGQGAGSGAYTCTYFIENLDLQEGELFEEELADSLSVSDDLAVVVTFKKALGDTMGLADSGILTFEKQLTDTFGLSDSLVLEYLLSLDDTLTISDLLEVIQRVSLGEVLSIADQLLVARVFYLTDTLSISDALTHQIIVKGGLSDLTVSPALIVTKCYAIADDVPKTEKLRIWAKARDGKEKVIYIDPV